MRSFTTITLVVLATVLAGVFPVAACDRPAADQQRAFLERQVRAQRQALLRYELDEENEDGLPEEAEPYKQARDRAYQAHADLKSRLETLGGAQAPSQ